MPILRYDLTRWPSPSGRYLPSAARPSSCGTCWTEHYFAPLAKARELFAAKYPGDSTAEGLMAFQRYEEELYRKYSEFYGYVFSLRESRNPRRTPCPGAMSCSGAMPCSGATPNSGLTPRRRARRTRSRAADADRTPQGRIKPLSNAFALPQSCGRGDFVFRKLRDGPRFRRPGPAAVTCASSRR